MKHLLGWIALWLVIFFAVPVRLAAQALQDGKFYLNADGSRYFKLTMVNQAWFRYNRSNPGTTVFGYPKESTTDIGIRRFRIQAFAQLTDRVFIYSQLGINNFNYVSDRKSGFFLHDAVGEYAVVKEKLSMGMGLAAWSGLARFASPSVGTILGIDAPLFEQSTNDVTDQFLRKLSVYAKGKLGKFDYRLALSSPLAFERAPTFNPAVTPVANFSAKPPKLQTQGYFQWQFLDSETNLTPYLTGTYLGAKRVFNLGAGFVYQPDAIWYRAANARDTVEAPMVQVGLDAYLDTPLDPDRGTALNVYTAYVRFDFGPNYTRNLGVMNPGTGSNRPDVLNGGGNAFPMFGTGGVIYSHIGYKLGKNFLGSAGTLLPYVSLQHGMYERLEQPMNFWDTGLTWLQKGHTSKLTIAYQSRPVFVAGLDTRYRLSDRQGTWIAQYQVFFN